MNYDSKAHYIDILSEVDRRQLYEIFSFSIEKILCKASENNDLETIRSFYDGLLISEFGLTHLFSNKNFIPNIINKANGSNSLDIYNLLFPLYFLYYRTCNEKNDFSLTIEDVNEVIKNKNILISQHINVLIPDEIKTLYMRAIIANNTELINALETDMPYLLHHTRKSYTHTSSDIDIIYYAIKTGNLKRLETLINKYNEFSPSKFEFSQFHIDTAMEYNQIDILNYMKDYGAQIHLNIEKLLSNKKITFNDNLISWLIENNILENSIFNYNTDQGKDLLTHLFKCAISYIRY